MKRFLKMYLAAILAVMALTGCNQNQNTIKEIVPIENNGTNPQTTPQINPLTGLSMNDGNVNARPIAVMINNIKIAQPLMGVDSADIMYECLVEGGITRIMAVFKDPTNIEAIGSVRSARPYYIDLARGLDAVYVHIGGSQDADGILKSGVIDHFNLGSYSGFMWRDEIRRKNLGYEHSALTSGKKLIECIKQNNVRYTENAKKTHAQTFNENSQVQKGSSCNGIKCVFSHYKETEFKYNDSKQTYFISQFDQAQIDGNVNLQNSKENILILKTNVWNINNSSLKGMELTGTGNGQYASREKIINIKWNKNSKDEPMTYKCEDGSELVMNPGKIYVCILPLDAQVDLSP